MHLLSLILMQCNAGRGTETEDSLQKRLNRATEDLEWALFCNRCSHRHKPSTHSDPNQVWHERRQLWHCHHKWRLWVSLRGVSGIFEGTLPFSELNVEATPFIFNQNTEWSCLTNEHRSTNKYFFLVWENPKSFLESLQRLWWRIMVFRCAHIPPLQNIEKVFRKFIFNPYCDLFTNKCWSVFECVLCTGIWMKVAKPFQCNYDDNEDRLILKNFGGGFLVKNICNILGERDPPLFDRK